MVTKSDDLKIWPDSVEVEIKKYNDPNYDDYICSDPCTINSFNQEFYKNSKRPTSTSLTDWNAVGNFSGSLLIFSAYLMNSRITFLFTCRPVILYLRIFSWKYSFLISFNF